jgi:hypothetical protein
VNLMCRGDDAEAFLLGLGHSGISEGAFRIGQEEGVDDVASAGFGPLVIHVLLSGNDR